MFKDKCEENIIHEDTVKTASILKIDEGKSEELASFYKNFSDKTRLNILSTLFAGEMCVCDISEVLKMTQSAVSHQLHLLRLNRLVKARKEGKSVFYSLDDEHIKVIFEKGLEHISHR